ncbi:hypothetical protein JCM3766R1_005711 [Sporobolomyces carnicolor]
MAPPNDPPLPEAYASPDKYLESARFHLTHTFKPSLSSRTTAVPPDGHDAVTVSYALCGSEDPSSKVLVWINGLGHHRLASMLLDGVCRKHNVRLLTFDRPSAGRSTPLGDAFSREPYRDRVELVAETLLELLTVHEIRRFSLLSHSNGVIYTLYFLLQLARRRSSSSGQDQDGDGARFECLEWFMTSPWISPKISGSVGLSIASSLPTTVTAKLGGFVEGVEKVIGPVGWSYGIAKEWVGWSAGIVSTPTAIRNEAADSSTTRARRRTSKEQIESFETLQSLKPVEERTFAGRYLPPGLLDRAMKRAVEEGLQGMGVEAVMSLRSDPSVSWGWLRGDEGDNDRDEAGIDEHELYERGFEKLKRAVDENDWHLEVKVWCAGQDGMIPRKGRDWFRNLVVDRLGIVEARAFKEAEKAGHDEILGLECVIEDVLTTVQQRP